MKKIEYIPKFTVSGKAMRLIMEIAAALERYKIVMEGPDGVRLRKLNHIRTIRGTTAIEGNTLDKILRTLKAKGEAYEVGEECRVKSRVKSRDKVLCLLRKQPDLTQAELANALGLTVKAIEKIVRQLRDANLIKREGGKKFGRWIVA